MSPESQHRIAALARAAQQARDGVPVDSGQQHKVHADRALIWMFAVVACGVVFFVGLAIAGPDLPVSHGRLFAPAVLCAAAPMTPA